MHAELTSQLQKAIDHLKEEYAGINVGRANPILVEEIEVESYGTRMPLKSMANISCPDSKTIRIEPWDKSIMASIEKGLRESSLGIMPQNMGEYILLPIPPMTEERRKQLVKVIHEEAENARVSVRNIRHDFLKQLKAQKDNKEISEDEVVKLEKQIQEQVDTTNKEIGVIAQHKEKDLLTV